jgi:hypothetical protein
MGGLRLEIGFVVVVSSATHLMVEDISAYAEETIVRTQRLARSFRGGVVCVPGLKNLLEGSDNARVVRAVADLCRWLPTLRIPELGGTGFLLGTASAIMKTLCAEGDNLQASYGVWYCLPSDYKGAKQRWYSEGPASLKNGAASLLEPE